MLKIIQNNINLLKHSSILGCALLALSACGGGGGGNNNSAPLANSDSISTKVNTPVSATFNVSDPDGDNLTYTIVSNTSSLGTVVITNMSTGEYTFTPAQDAFGTDSFTFRASDGSLESNLAPVTINIEEPIPPVAVNDAYNQISEGASLTKNAMDGVLQNDNDPNNDTITAVLETAPAFSSSFILNTDGSFSYQHDGSENFSDNFTYTDLDETGQSSTIATVTISITPVNDAPVSVADAGTTLEGSATNINVVTNDTDVDGTLDPTTVTVVSAPSNGSTLVNAISGLITYTHNSSETTSDTFTYTVQDDFGATTAPATVTITVTPVNDAPIVTNDNTSAGEGASTNINVLLNDTDIDSSIDPTTVSVINNATFGNTSVNGTTGEIRYTHDGSESTTDSFTYTVRDINGATSLEATVFINITPFNDPPVAMATCSTTPQESTFNGVLAGDDPDSLLMFSLGADGSGGLGPMPTAKGSVLITDATTGAYTYTPNTTGQRGIDTFEFLVSDEDNSSTSTETIILDQKIMPLGDSITAGTISVGIPVAGARVGYRQTLYDDIETAGFFIDFVGSKQEGTSATPPITDPDHEGHGGWTASELVFGRAGGYPTDGVRAWLEMNPADIVLLHIGTNGLDPNADIDVEAILDDIDTWEASPAGNPVTVVLAMIIDWNPSNPDVAAFNTNVANMVAARTGDDVIIVDQLNALYTGASPDPALYGDLLHPNQAGYTLMSDVWLDSLLNDLNINGNNLLDKCP